MMLKQLNEAMVDQLIDVTENTPPPPVPPKCKELLECAND
jgi:hypothetical protein